MEFQVKVNGVLYNIKIKTLQNGKLTYLVKAPQDQVEISLGDDNEWISLHIGSAADSIPVEEIGKAIQSHFH